MKKKLSSISHRNLLDSVICFYTSVKNDDSVVYRKFGIYKFNASIFFRSRKLSSMISLKRYECDDDL